MFSRRQISRPTVFVLALALTTAIPSCGGDGGTGVDPITSVSVSPGTATLESIGATVQLSAVASGTGAASATFTWTSSDPTVASVAPTGLVTSVSNGTTTVSARADGTTLSGSATVTVAQVATSIELTPATGSLTPGETVQMVATVQDANENDVTADLTWTSDDDAVATVDASGLVTGVAVGEAVISATQDAATGTADLVVGRPDFAPTTDVTLGGTVEVDEITIPVGVTVTLSDDAVIDAEGPVVIAGDVTGDCKGLSLTGHSTVTISGTFRNACTTVPTLEDPPELKIVGNEVVTLDDAVITSSGDIFISNELGTSPAQAQGRGAPGAATTDPKLSMARATVSHWPTSAPRGQDVTQDGADADVRAANGGRGGDTYLHHYGVLFVEGTTITAQDGGNGGDVTLTSSTLGTPPVARGGHGGSGGDMSLQLSVKGGYTEGTPFSFTAGDGGYGGDATATGTSNTSTSPAPGAHAIGGDGGDQGEGEGGGVSDGDAGSGGDAIATAARGADATTSRAAQQGGTAIARGGDAGDDDGDGGDATAVAGDGGNGESVVNRDGATGGGADAEGVDNEGGGDDGTAVVSGGNGGNGASACVTTPPQLMMGMIWVLFDPAYSDFWIFAAGGPPGISFAVLFELLYPGGDGGAGGTIIQVAGGGDDYEVAPSAGPGFNGGNGGAGVPPGAAGAAGTQTSTDTPTQVEPLLRPGTAGGACPVGAPSTPSILATIGPASAASG
ncbi:MAG: Ig domain-containing protein, partial [Deltaproteobacteria bacterium]|nr:Ig domain-containing protein [Deltaproteobacteria bacterium]